MAKELKPAAAPMTSRMAPAILLPASRLISCARWAISAAVSRASAARCPGPRRGAALAGGASPSVTISSSACGKSAMGRTHSFRQHMEVEVVARRASETVEPRLLITVREHQNAGNYMIFSDLCKASRRDFRGEVYIIRLPSWRLEVCAWGITPQFDLFFRYSIYTA